MSAWDIVALGAAAIVQCILCYKWGYSRGYTQAVDEWTGPYKTPTSGIWWLKRGSNESSKRL